MVTTCEYRFSESPTGFQPLAVNVTSPSLAIPFCSGISRAFISAISWAYKSGVGSVGAPLPQRIDFKHGTTAGVVVHKSLANTPTSTCVAFAIFGTATMLPENGTSRTSLFHLKRAVFIVCAPHSESNAKVTV